MERFDDIPIKVLNKADGYQQPAADEQPFDEETDESKLSMP